MRVTPSSSGVEEDGSELPAGVSVPQAVHNNKEHNKSRKVVGADIIRRWFSVRVTGQGATPPQYPEK
jgi:hypothetical protein